MNEMLDLCSLMWAVLQPAGSDEQGQLGAPFILPTHPVSSLAGADANTSKDLLVKLMVINLSSSVLH